MSDLPRIRSAHPFTVAFFSMEVGLDPAMPTYAGGLGILSGDTLRAAADMGVSMVGVTLLHRKGYFRQHLDAQGNQTESPAEWLPESFLEPLPFMVSVSIEGRQVQVRAWRYIVYGIGGHPVPVYFLDTATSQNSPWDQTLTDHLYGGDAHYRLCQEAVLGLGGIAMLRAIGHDRVRTYHMNEGHSALLTLALLKERAQGRGLLGLTKSDREAVRRRCVFTTHTPVPAGQDQFSLDLVRGVLGEEQTAALQTAECCLDSVLNMTYLGLANSHYINGVSMRHEEISSSMFPNYPINSVTNGVHAVTWTSKPFRDLYDQHIPEWRRDNLYLRYAISIPLDDIQKAHEQAKRDLLAEVERRSGVRLDPAILTLGFARRATAYKRADLLFSDLDRLRKIASDVGPLQVIYSGKAHPRDEAGKAQIRRVFRAAEALRGAVQVVYLEEYDMALGQSLCAGVDLWMNTPQKPLEASGTSGMKAALNGVPSLSVLDGWWVEGHVEGITGWSIGDNWEPGSNPDVESASLYHKLENAIMPLFYKNKDDFSKVMRWAIALNGSYYHAQRMVLQYMENAYLATGKG
ncbi:MAG: alpha-glucan family phosphorylase [Chloroflexi bacterium]|nr:alpha-glucan family phosphorylase [Chloroflexota bacterium]